MAPRRKPYSQLSVEEKKQNWADIVKSFTTKKQTGENKRFSKSNLINPVPDNNIDEKVWEQIKGKLEEKKEIICDMKVKNTDRAIGTKLSQHIFKNYGDKLLQNILIHLI